MITMMLLLSLSERRLRQNSLILQALLEAGPLVLLGSKIKATEAGIGLNMTVGMVISNSFVTTMPRGGFTVSLLW